MWWHLTYSSSRINSGRWKLTDKLTLLKISCLNSHVSTGIHRNVTGRSVFKRWMYPWETIEILLYPGVPSGVTCRIALGISHGFDIFITLQLLKSCNFYRIASVILKYYMFQNIWWIQIIQNTWCQQRCKVLEEQDEYWHCNGIPSFLSS